jgi:hypothetical protein
MITIEERVADKVPGLTSLFITFEYNKDIIDVIKTCDGSYWNKKKLWWEVPLLNLSYLLDMLTLVDDITLKLIKDEKPHTIEYEKREGDILFPHQVEGIKFGLSRDRWLLLDAPGLGKTLQIIRLAEELQRTRNINHCLIICGLNSLK